MGAMDVLVNEVDSKFGLGAGKASSLLTALLALIQEQRGGLAGFLDRFRNAGLGDMVSKWLTGGPAQPVSSQSLETALGQNTLSSIASRTGFAVSPAASALGFLVPKLIQTLAPGGAIPTRLPSDALSYLTGATGMVTAGARQAVHAAEQSGLRRWLWPIVALLAALLLFAFWPKGRPATTAFNADEQIRLASEKASAAL